MACTPSSSQPAGSRDAQNSVPEVEVLDHFQDGSAWSTFHRIRYRVRGFAGGWIEGEREFLDRGDAVALLPYCRATGMVLLTRQFRMPIHLKRPGEAMLLEVCGGILDAKDPLITVRHEANDELGLELGPAEKVFEGYSTPGSVCELVHYFLAPYEAGSRGPGGGNRHEGEDIEVVEMALEEALRQIGTGAIRDVRTIALLLYLQVRNQQADTTARSAAAPPNSPATEGTHRGQL